MLVISHDDYSGRVTVMHDACCDDCDKSSQFGADAAVQGVTTRWVSNAVKTAGKPLGTGAAKMDAKGNISGVERLPFTKPGLLPKLTDENMLMYLANIGFINAHQDPTVRAALSVIPKVDATGFYIGNGLMQHRIGEKQFLMIRSLLTPTSKKAFDTAASLHIGRVIEPGSGPSVPQIFSPFGAEADVNVDFDTIIDTAKKADDNASKAIDTAQKAANTAGKLADGDYAGAAGEAIGGDLGGDLAKGAAIGGAVAAGVGTVVAAGAAIGTAIPIPVVGTAVGAAVGAAVAGAIALGHAIFDNKPAFSEDDYTRHKTKCKALGGIQVGGVAPDLYGACKNPKDGSVTGGDWPFWGTWNHEIRDNAAYRRNWTAYCQSLGGDSYFPTPNGRGQCRFPDGYTTDGGEFYKPVWPEDKRAEYEADQIARKLQYSNLASYIAGLKEIDKMYAAADAAMRKPGATIAARNIWMKKIGDAFAKIYNATGQTKYAPLNVAGFVNDPVNQRRVFTPAAPKVALLPMNISKMMITVKPVATPPKLILPRISAGLLITKGVVGATPEQKTAIVQQVIADPQMKQGAVTAIKEVAIQREGWFTKLLHWLHIGKPIVATK